MKKLFRYIKFYLKTAFRNIRRHLGLTLSASFSVSITLILIALFVLISVNITNITKGIEGELTIRVSIDTIVKEEKVNQMMEDIKAFDGVKKVAFSSGLEELESYREEYEDEQSIFSMYEGKNSPIRDALIVELQEGKMVESTAKKIRKLDGVVSADYGGSESENLIKGMEILRNGSVIFILFLLCVAIFLIANKIKMSIYTRKEEIAIMRYVGTSNLSVKLPMMIEGTFIGFLGAVLPIVLTITLYKYIYDQMNGALLSEMLQLQPVFPLTIQVSLVLAGVGMIVGLFGGFISTTRYLHWKR